MVVQKLGICLLVFRNVVSMVGQRSLSTRFAMINARLAIWQLLIPRGLLWRSYYLLQILEAFLLVSAGFLNFHDLNVGYMVYF